MLKGGKITLSWENCKKKIIVFVVFKSTSPRMRPSHTQVKVQIQENMKPSLNKLPLLETFDHSFNETNKPNTFIIKPLRFPVIEIRSSGINWTYWQTHVFLLLVKLQSRSLTSKTCRYLLLYFIFL